MFIHSRIVRVIKRLDRFVMRWQAGTLPKPRPARLRPARGAKPPKFQVPNGYVWLIKLIQATAQFGGQLQAFMMNQRTRARVAAAPQAARLMRSFCRMLAIEMPEYLRPPHRPPQMRPPRIRPPQPAPLKPASGEPALTTQLSIPQGTPDRPIPRNILAEARAWRRYDL